VFNLSGSEMVFLLLLALIVLGPEKLPEAVRRFGRTYGEVKKMTSGFQSELRSALDEPMREMRETADALRKAATIDIDGFSLDATSPAATPYSTPAAAVTVAEPPAVQSGPAEDETETPRVEAPPG